jgi:hypothetical protein
MKKILSVLAIALTLVSTSCKKPEGPGGQATITGRVHETNFSMNNGIYVENGQWYSPDADVYIIYGEEATYGDKVSTSPEGVFEFKYLRPGTYRIYVYSKDKEAIVDGNAYAPEIAIEKTVEISDKKGTVDAGTFEIYR